MNQKKKILLLSTGDINGAYEAIYRIASFLKEDGHEVAMVVQKKTKKDPFVFEILNQKTIFRKVYDKVVQKLNDRYKKKIDPKYLFLDEDESKKYVDVKDILEAIPFIPEFVITGMT